MGPGAHPAGQPRKGAPTVRHRQEIPAFNLTGVVSNDATHAFKDIDDKTYAGEVAGRVLLAQDFTFVCPTEIAGFGKLNVTSRIATRSCSASARIRISCTSARQSYPDLRDPPFPMPRTSSASLEGTGILDPEPASPSARLTSSIRRA
jgi:peroxiredoxin (alkyl hydroperoxide reductase subunit C)